jgi:hypothetical protein
MAKDNTILERARILRHKLDGDWKVDFEEMGIWEDVEPLYAHVESKKNANIIFIYIVFAYHSKSEYINPHKDRLEVKRSIMRRFAGKESLDKELFLDAVLGGDAVIDNLIEFIINDQRDWRWNTIISNMEFASKVTAKSRTEDFKESADLLDLADKRREKADKLLEEIRRDFVELDGSLDQEGKQKITERTQDFMSWEMFVKKKKLDDAAKEAEDREKAASKTKRKKEEYDDSPI